MAKRRSRKRKPRISWWMIAAIALLIAGFLARRLMMPPAARYLGHQAEDAPAASDNAPSARANDNPQGEHLSDSDRRALDEVIRRKTERP